VPQILIMDIDAEGVELLDTHLSGDTPESVFRSLEENLACTASQEFTECTLHNWAHEFHSQGFQFSMDNGNGCLVRFEYLP
jgi:hypothetical protein